MAEVNKELEEWYVKLKSPGNEYYLNFLTAYVVTDHSGLIALYLSACKVGNRKSVHYRDVNRLIGYLTSGTSIEILEEARELIEKYANIPDNEPEDHDHEEYGKRIKNLKSTVSSLYEKLLYKQSLDGEKVITSFFLERKSFIDVVSVVMTKADARKKFEKQLTDMYWLTYDGIKGLISKFISGVHYTTAKEDVGLNIAALKVIHDLGLNGKFNAQLTKQMYVMMEKIADDVRDFINSLKEFPSLLDANKDKGQEISDVIKTVISRIDIYKNAEIIGNENIVEEYIKKPIFNRFQKLKEGNYDKGTLSAQNIFRAIVEFEKNTKDQKGLVAAAAEDIIKLIYADIKKQEEKAYDEDIVKYLSNTISFMRMEGFVKKRKDLIDKYNTLEARLHALEKQATYDRNEQAKNKK